MRAPLDKYTLPDRSSQGWFGATRKHDIHTGIDLYCEPNDVVHAIESGYVVSVSRFTGPKAGSPWWHDTDAVLVRGASGLILYGEVSADVSAGQAVSEGQRLGRVVTVLRNDKGLPMTMLHLELYELGYSPNEGDAGEVWKLGECKPEYLVNPQILLPEFQGKFTWNDMEWAFDKGVHEGWMRKAYEGSDGHAKSDLEFYKSSYYEHEKNRNGLIKIK